MNLPKYDERRGAHVWTKGDKESPVLALRLDYWSYEPIGEAVKSAKAGK